MFPLHLHNTNHSCFSAKVRDAAWLWHFRYGHLNFGGLKTLQQKNMVIGLPQIAAPSGVCEEWVVSKQHRNQFPQGPSWRAKKSLALVHSDICGPITPCSNGDQKRKKLDDKGEKCIFLGVSDQSKAYKLYNPITKKILISRDVIFDEAQTWPWNTNVVGEQIPTSFDGENDDEANQSKQRLVPAIATLENPQNEAPMASEITPTTPEVDEQVEAAAGSRSHRVRKRPAWMSDYEVPGIDQSDDPLTHFALFSDCDPTVFESAMKDCNPVSIPSEFGLKLNKDNGGKMVDNTLFKQIVGSLMYLIATRPDIMHADNDKGKRGIVSGICKKILKKRKLKKLQRSGVLDSKEEEKPENIVTRGPFSSQLIPNHRQFKLDHIAKQQQNFLVSMSGQESEMTVYMSSGRNTSPATFASSRSEDVFGLDRRSRHHSSPDDRMAFSSTPPPFPTVQFFSSQTPATTHSASFPTSPPPASVASPPRPQ
ncbi:hypothetical protein RHSIM_Rhsim02G0093400 [Rhododendron simsii]|uniref:GAG-pre-integrase domain-containing protein n=1 Tax=Rhododendron simsii TaxID=118357 RepID=A0A834LU94_RHOSS|nr:hypothetical protein RHSIM_Rhsim02G0093400 [Rhododendron simsii]